jgi:hypothetical protein
MNTKGYEMKFWDLFKKTKKKIHRHHKEELAYIKKLEKKIKNN